MKEKAEFQGAYLGGLEDLARASAEEKPGWLMSALIRSYLETIADWKTEDPQEYYKTLFIAARRFVLPMNPPRVELDYAVRLIFTEHGLTVKRSRLPTRSQAQDGEGEAVPKKRRSRRRRKPAEAPDGGQGGAGPEA
jgi:poly(A) polymerase